MYFLTALPAAASLFVLTGTGVLSCTGLWVYTGVLGGGDSSCLDGEDPDSLPRDAKFILSLSMC